MPRHIAPRYSKRHYRSGVAREHTNSTDAILHIARNGRWPTNTTRRQAGGHGRQGSVKTGGFGMIIERAQSIALMMRQAGPVSLSATPTGNSRVCLIRGGGWLAHGCQAHDSGRGAAHRGQYREAARAVTLAEMTPHKRLVQTLVIAGGILIVGCAVSYAQPRNDQQNGQWCAYFTGGPTNCSFATFEECLQAIKGKTALCDQNHQYAPPASAQPSPDHRRRRSHQD